MQEIPKLALLLYSSSNILNQVSNQQSHSNQENAMKTTPTLAAFRRKNYIKGKIASAARMLRAVDDKLGQMQDDFDDDARSSCDRQDVKDSRQVVRFLADMLDEGDDTSLPPAAFDAIASH